MIWCLLGSFAILDGVWDHVAGKLPRTYQDMGILERDT